jgi:rhomboid protease GluP
LLSGLGGAFASLLFHPFGVCAGASGAIFGVVGGLLAFLVARRGDFPAGLLKRMRSSTLAFVGSNIIFGMMFPMIDMAGHLGGLVSGFIVGLCLCPRPMARPDTVGRLRRLGVIVALVLVFAGFSRPVLRAARTQIEVELEAARAE